MMVPPKQIPYINQLWSLYTILLSSIIAIRLRNCTLDKLGTRLNFGITFQTIVSNFDFVTVTLFS